MEQERKYFINDIESGLPYEVTKDQYEAYHKAWDAVKPKLDSVKGKVILFGTGGDMESGTEDFSSIFYNSGQWNSKE